MSNDRNDGPRAAPESPTAVTVKLSEHGRTDSKISGSPDRTRTRASARNGRLVDQLLDQALEDTFPASDPIAIGR